ncbi:hypothetical protein MN116_005201 [Schistosoma mekongi]|uniref:dihydropyrimidinase n=1 Tax=Schistosoma mekongi TaxID=38744 RepID=A0AAE2D5D5_SCHME|nr:hypothetical protein MN116_005201 [Schistosoma mekongi]
MPDDASIFKPLLLKGGTIVNHDASFKSDVLIQNGIIQAIGENLSYPDGTDIIDVSNKLLLPGGIDLDCHVGVASPNDPVADTYLSAGKAALLGGTTTIVNTVNACPGKSLINSYEQFISAAHKNLVCDYGVCFRLAGFSPEINNELIALVQDKGVVLFSVRLGSKTPPIIDDNQCINEEEFCYFLKSCRQLGALPMLEAATSVSLSQKLTSDVQISYPDIGPEVNLITSPEETEANIVLQGSLFSQYAGFCCPLLISRIHSEAALNCFIEQRRMCRGLLFGQTTVPAIAIPLSLMSSNDYSDDVLTRSKDWAVAASYINHPPLRPFIHLSQRLLTHLVSGDLACVGSGHRAITTSVRAAFGLKNAIHIPPGIAALGCRMVVLWHFGVEAGYFDPSTFVKVTSTNPARLMNIYPQKGRVEVGSDADIVVWSNSYKQEALKNIFPVGVPNVFSNTVIYQSGPEIVILRGHIVVQNNEFLNNSSSCGKLLICQPFSHYVYARVNSVEKSINSEFTIFQREPYAGNVASSVADISENCSKEGYYFRKEHYDNIPKVALPPGQRKIHTSVKTAQPPGGSSNAFWSNE